MGFITAMRNRTFERIVIGAVLVWLALVLAAMVE
jgi:hypothetical protein